ncbi:MAG: N-acetyltransferase family protein [Candidatus Dojkabacteria bacterium]
MSTIRKAELKDYSAIKNLMLIGLKEDPTAFSVSFEEYEPNSEYWWMGYINPFLTSVFQEMYLSFDGANLEGMVGITYDNKQRKKHIANFVWFYVEKSHRGKGIGRALIDKALEVLSTKKEITKLSLLVVATQEKAIEIYKKNGFEINGTLKKELKISSEFFDVLIMERVKEY